MKQQIASLDQLPSIFINKVLFVLILFKGLKNEDGYEISIPCEDNTLDESGFFNQSDHTFDGIYFSRVVAE